MFHGIACDGFKTQQKLLGVTDKIGSNNVLEIWTSCRDFILNIDNTVVTYTLTKESFLSIKSAHSFRHFFL